MRIAYLASSCIPSRTANSIHVMKMSQAFACNGHDICLIVPDRPDCMEHDVGDVFAYYGVQRVFELWYRPWSKLPGRSFLNALSSARAARLWQAELVYGRNVLALFFAAFLGSKGVVFESHHPIEDSPALIRKMFAVLLARKSFLGMVVITDALKRHYEERWPELAGRVLVAPDGADPMDCRQMPEILPGRRDAIKVGYVGNMYAGKGMELIALLVSRCPWADFHLVGGTEGDILYWQSKMHGVHHVYFHGYVPHGQTRAFIAACDILLLPNQNSVSTHGERSTDIGKWTSPLKLFEYMAAGKAIVASNLPVLCEILEQGRNALLCDPAGPAEWQAALEQLRDNPGLRDVLAGAAKLDFEKRYSWSQRAINIITKYG
ncbi:glycosyltransferase [Chlorobium phaeovibrioides]|uniref:Glycosyltransferase n=1 Tax=Chlorobium phaeovibrioides TaxID=1094 RepID=A0A3S0L0Q6_CHLPH|nr:glycosyltransferase family 4 protein [Chlorobium phaeovibrioides]RTY35187.1 glycosyltransferase [Chlorobium phaeovibrioides]